MRQTLADNGFNEPVIHYSLTPQPDEQLVNIAFTVTSGPQARVGGVAVSGDPGMTSMSSSGTMRICSTGAQIDHETEQPGTERSPEALPETGTAGS